ncbi:transposase [Paenibacillus sp. FSL E2-0178]|uniref:transposase n=2 Tax=Paenibacillus sp. FSL E2-0178 TaxID=2921361 RepID=UPI0031587BA7
MEKNEKFDATAFQRFLVDMLQAYSKGKLVMVLDNVTLILLVEFSPSSEASEAPTFFPKYSPELNPAEGMWKWLKQDVVNNLMSQPS